MGALKYLIAHSLILFILSSGIEGQLSPYAMSKADDFGNAAAGLMAKGADKTKTSGEQAADAAGVLAMSLLTDRTTKKVLVTIAPMTTNMLATKAPTMAAATEKPNIDVAATMQKPDQEKAFKYDGPLIVVATYDEKASVNSQ
ncbi:hypothetical protein Ciccas_011049 [Cichlidogyrus casuarinus]|uniref:Uncharacterized protein n=1 Tax=Cichlidogyrus casuarinus TaxID=1844966 RepID=A0ABD2PT16_9PLAT